MLPWSPMENSDPCVLGGSHAKCNRCTNCPWSQQGWAVQLSRVKIGCQVWQPNDTPPRRADSASLTACIHVRTGKRPGDMWACAHPGLYLLPGLLMWCGQLPDDERNKLHQNLERTCQCAAAAAD
eukprot:352205-Chlamydomonas_euryale.AAC.1